MKTMKIKFIFHSSLQILYTPFTQTWRTNSAHTSSASTIIRSHLSYHPPITPKLIGEWAWLTCRHTNDTTSTRKEAWFLITLTNDTKSVRKEGVACIQTDQVYKGNEEEDGGS